jgi:hypothetical protein
MYQVEFSGYLLWRTSQFVIVRDFAPKYIPRLQTALDFGLDKKSGSPILSRYGFVSPADKGAALRADLHRGNPVFLSNSRAIVEAERDNSNAI